MELVVCNGLKYKFMEGHHYQRTERRHRAASEMVFQPIHRDTGAALHDERFTAAREEPNQHIVHVLVKCDK